jgi:hypothetical protein
MLSLNVVKCVIQWRKQLIFNFMSTQQHRTVPTQQSLRKFKVMPFVWESQNYLLKLKSDIQFLLTSAFSKYFNFSMKSDPFLVFPSTKQLGGVPGSRARRTGTNQKVLIPLANSHMKLIRQSEVYLMEEAVTESIIRQAHQQTP